MARVRSSAPRSVDHRLKSICSTRPLPAQRLYAMGDGVCQSPRTDAPLLARLASVPTRGVRLGVGHFGGHFVESEKYS